MRVGVLDIEGAYMKHPHPWTAGSYLSAVGIYVDGTQHNWVFAHRENMSNNQGKHFDEIQEMLDSCDLIVGHNLKFDITWLRSFGIKISNRKLFCTQNAEYLLYGQRKIGYSLNDCCKRHLLPTKIDKVAAFWESGTDTCDIPLAILLEYLGQDCKITRLLYDRQRVELERRDLMKLMELVSEVTGILSEVELNGFKLDVPHSEKLVEEYREKLDALTAELKNKVGFEFNPESPQQMSVVLYGGSFKEKQRVKTQKILKSGRVKHGEKWDNILVTYAGLGFKPGKDAETSRPGYYSVDKNTLQFLKPKNALQRDIINILLMRSNTSKVLKTFVSSSKDSAGLLDIVDRNGFVHPGFNQTTTSTGRLSSSKPNGQNLPRKGTSPIKKVIIPRNGFILNADLAQIEWRMAGAMSRDAMIIAEINNNIDAHADNAIRFFGASKFPRDSKEFKKLRTDAKIFTFGMIYGRTSHGFYNDKKMPFHTEAQWQRIVDDFYAKYSGLKEWQLKNVDTVVATGFLRTPSGRVLSFPKVRRRDGSIGPKETAIYNYPVQSISADVVYLAMSRIDRAVKEAELKSQIILQVHDSIVFDAFEEEIDALSCIVMSVFNSLRDLCNECWGWDTLVPLTGDIEVGLTYGDIVPYTIYNSRGQQKLLVNFKYTDADGKEKKESMWVLNEHDVLNKFPAAFDFSIAYSICPK